MYYYLVRHKHLCMKCPCIEQRNCILADAMDRSRPLNGLSYELLKISRGLKLSNQLVTELKEADIIVMGTPVYNLVSPQRTEDID